MQRKIKIQHIEKNNIPTELYQMPVLVFGGGYSGKIIINLLISEGIKIKNIVDDNEMIQGTYIENIEVISFEKFRECNGQGKDTIVILSTIYGKMVLKRLDEYMPYVQVFELYDWLLELTGIKNIVYEIKKIQEMERQLGSLKNTWADYESEHVLDGLICYLKTKDLNNIAEICTEEEQYFISEVNAAINHPLYIIDAGACRGELLQSLKNHHLSFKKWYCFEADVENYTLLLKQSKINGLEGQQVCINKGLWCDSKKLFFQVDGETRSKIVSYETDNVISAVSIDDYLGEVSCNYIKMDIEGAELPALKGGINLIKRERPILAISIYHSLEDFWQIPQYLMSQLDNYRYYVRHHALIFCETVLYAIPNELGG